MITLVFENLDEIKNCEDESELVVDGSVYRTTMSPYANHLRMTLHYQESLNHPSTNTIRFNKTDYSIQLKHVDDNIDGKYIIPVGVNQSPESWMCDFYQDSRYDWKNLYDKLSDKYLRDLREGVAYLMIDNSLEGYHSDDIFTYLHDNAVSRSINPRQIIYVTGNLNIDDNLKEWLLLNPDKSPILTIPYAHFEFDIGRRSYETIRKDLNILPTTTTHKTHKQSVLGFDDIKLYNFLNKKARNHRFWMYTSLEQSDLINDGIVSMNPLEYHSDLMIDSNTLSYDTILESNKNLPVYAYNDNTNDKDFQYYMYNFNQKPMLNSWISIISETHFDDSQKTCFLSEKTFKTIATQTPFMILGNKGSLKKLHDLGYKTFHNIINENYDTLDSVHRIEAIVEELKAWKSNPNKFRHWSWLKSILEHNFEVLKFNSLFNPPPKFFEIAELLK